MSILKTEGLSVGYGGKPVISGINIEAVKGKVICLLGKNGSGKTTLLRTMAGLLAPTEGSVFLDGTDIRRADRRFIARNLSVVLTEQRKPALMTAGELVLMGRSPYTGFMGKISEKDISAAEKALVTVGAAELRDKYVSALSDGELQKIMIARALVQEPKVIILDEPTAHLDIQHRTDIIRTLRRLSSEKGITCIISLHDIDLAVKGCEVILLVNGGKIEASGSPDEILDSGLIEKIFCTENTAYSRLTGMTEFRGGAGSEIFVVCGGGSGAAVMRELALKGAGLAAGVLHENDIDCEIAKLICSEVVTEKPFEPISGESIAKAKAIIDGCRCVIDCGFPVGSCNKGNLSLIEYARASGKEVQSAEGRGRYRKGKA